MGPPRRHVRARRRVVDGVRIVKLADPPAVENDDAISHRERLGRFGSVDDLDEVPGFPQDVLEDLKRRSRV